MTLMARCRTTPIHKVVVVCLLLFCFALLLTLRYTDLYEKHKQRCVGLPQKQTSLEVVTDKTALDQKYRKERIRRVCKMIEAGAYKMKNNPEDMRPSYLRILVDHYTKVAQCDIAKVGSVTWLKVHTSIAKRDHKQRSKLFMTHPYEFYGELPSDSYRKWREYGFNRLSKGDDIGREMKDGYPDPRKEYFKFMFTRHPLDRLASGYLDKCVKEHGYRLPVIRMKSIAIHGDDVIRDEYVEVSFEEFLRYVGRPDEEFTEHIDVHFMSYQSNCFPCTMDYDFIGRMDTLQSDIETILPIVGGEEFLEDFPRGNPGTNLVQSKYAHMYRNISVNVLERVLDKYRVDADMFGYEFDEYLNS